MRNIKDLPPTKKEAQTRRTEFGYMLANNDLGGQAPQIENARPLALCFTNSRRSNMLHKFFATIKARKEDRAALRLEEVKTQAHIELSNLYLRVERGEVKMSITISNKLQTLIGFLYPRHEDKWEISLSDHWMEECQKLPGWFNF